MKDIAVDTDVFSYVFKGDTRAQAYRPFLSNAKPCLSFMSVAELYHWAIARRWGASKIDALKREIAGYSILGYDDETAWQWAQIMSVPGRKMAVGDAWIAASAIRHGIPLLTHNRKHYEKIAGLILLP